MDSCQIPDLWFLLARFLGERDEGFFVEVGAFDGHFASNTHGVAQRRWRGIMIEPVPEFADQCRTAWKGYTGIEVVEAAITDRDGEELQLFLGGPLTTADIQLRQEYDSIQWSEGVLTGKSVLVETLRLDTLLDSRGWPNGFDLLVVDVEGYELKVFEGFSLDRWRPKMLIVELADTHPDLTNQAASHAVLTRRICSSSYEIVFKDRVNTVFVRRDVWERVLGESE